MQETEPTVKVLLADNPWQRAIEPYIQEFEAEYGIHAEVQVLAEQQARDRIVLNLQTHSSAMDVFMTLPSREGPQFSAAEWYGSIDDLLVDSRVNLDDFTPTSLQSVSVAGHPVALPINVETTALYYRTDVFERLGLRPPETIDQLVDAVEIIADEGRITPFTSRGLAAALPFTFSAFLHSEGGEWATEAGTPALNSPQAIRAISVYSDLLGEHGPPGVINNSFSQNSMLVSQGKVAINIESTNELMPMIGDSSLVASDLAVSDFPASGAGSRPTVMSWGLAVSAFAQDRDGAVSFIRWATSPEMQARLAVDGIAPPRSSVFESPELRESAESTIQKQWLAVLERAQQGGSVEVGPVGGNAGEMRRVIGNAVGRAILGEATPEDATEEMQRELAPLMSG